MSTSRKVTVYNTKGGQPKSIESSATKWGDLRTEIEGQGYAVDKLLATESVTRRDLNNLEATLPEGDFIVFLRPKKTKSGNSLGYKDARNKINGIIEKDGEPARVHFCDNPAYGGKNYTNMSTADLNKILGEYTPSSSPVVDNSQQMSEEVAEIENSDSIEPVKALTSSDKVQRAIDYLDEVADEMDDEDVYDRIDDIKGELEGLKADVVACEDPEAEAKRQEEEAQRLAEEAEAQRLADEAQKLMDDFRD